jgi:hypothetical protein
LSAYRDAEGLARSQDGSRVTDAILCPVVSDGLRHFFARASMMQPCGAHIEHRHADSWTPLDGPALGTLSPAAK